MLIWSKTLILLFSKRLTHYNTLQKNHTWFSSNDIMLFCCVFRMQVRSDTHSCFVTLRQIAYTSTDNDLHFLPKLEGDEPASCTVLSDPAAVAQHCTLLMTCFVTSHLCTEPICCSWCLFPLLSGCHVCTHWLGLDLHSAVTGCSVCCSGEDIWPILKRVKCGRQQHRHCRQRVSHYTILLLKNYLTTLTPDRFHISICDRTERKWAHLQRHFWQL